MPPLSPHLRLGNDALSHQAKAGVTPIRKNPCTACGGTGSVRVHGPEDYGVSFESEECEGCDGTGERRR
jgi:DnaJ-class molecular chaperone